jgi:photosystem II stability/assembly factor-like uncharacterized protein
VAIDPANPNRVYASLWDHHRNNGARVYGGIGSGLFRSDDGGQTWTRLQNVNGVASDDAAKTGLTADPSLGRIGIAIAPSDPSRSCVVAGAPYGPSKGTYVSDDGGDSFTPVAPAYAANGYHWWFGRIWVDPTDANHIFNADVNLRESHDGGKTWLTQPGGVTGTLHADQHAMAWDPRVPGRVYEGNDGGSYRSDANGAPATWLHGTYVEPELPPGRGHSESRPPGHRHAGQRLRARLDQRRRPGAPVAVQRLRRRRRPLGGDRPVR